MTAFNLEPTDETPTVVLDKENNVFELSGKSLPEDVTTFYDPILEWLDSYAENALDETVFNFKMIYFNTASSKLIMDILLKLEDMEADGANVKVVWHYQEEDEDMMEAGEEFSDIVDIPFELVSFE